MTSPAERSKEAREPCRQCAGTGVVVMDRRATHGYYRPETCYACATAPDVTITVSNEAKP